MRTGLLASMVTPGITAPVESFTTPAIALVCAKAVLDAANNTPTTAAVSFNISPPKRAIDENALENTLPCPARQGTSPGRYTARVASSSLRCHDRRYQRGVGRRRAGGPAGDVLARHRAHPVPQIGRASCRERE